MKSTTITYSLRHLCHVEVTRYPRNRTLRIQFVLDGQAENISKDALKSFVENVEELKKDLKL